VDSSVSAVFLSHASEDAKAVARIAQALRSTGRTSADALRGQRFATSRAIPVAMLVFAIGTTSARAAENAPDHQATILTARHAPTLAGDPADMPLWAYGVTTSPRTGDAAEPQRAPGPWFDPAVEHDEQLKPLHIEGSKRSYTLLELNDWQHMADWFPEAHAQIPRVIERGPESLGARTRACGFCHRVLGAGRPENAPVFGLPVGYFLRQLDDFRTGRRHSSDPRKPNVPTMIALAKAISDDEARAAAEYWATQTGGPHVRVVETEKAPRAELHGNLYVATAIERTELLVGRILEVPEDHTKSGPLDDSRSGFVAYVPIGSVERGRKLATLGTPADASSLSDSPAPACVSCHGADLRGFGDAPPIAGRSPSYIVRQLYDLKTGARNGTMAPFMKQLVAQLTASQMTDVAAYLATLPREDQDLPWLNGPLPGNRK
jgi:cytochrome c553